MLRNGHSGSSILTTPQKEDLLQKPVIFLGATTLARKEAEGLKSPPNNSPLSWSHGTAFIQAPKFNEALSPKKK